MPYPQETTSRTKTAHERGREEIEETEKEGWRGEERKLTMGKDTSKLGFIHQANITLGFCFSFVESRLEIRKPNSSVLVLINILHNFVDISRDSNFEGLPLSPLLLSSCFCYFFAFYRYSQA